MKKIYIAGPMTGLPDNNYPTFHAAATLLRAQGHMVANPAENEAPSCGTWLGYMRLALAQLIQCDAVHLLPGWSRSRGAMVEFTLAKGMGLEVQTAEGAEPVPHALQSNHAAQSAPAAEAAPDERAAFEKWASFVGYSIKRWRDDANLYEDNATEDAWIAWEARAALAAAPAAPAGWKLVPVQVPDSAYQWVSGGYSTDYRASDPRDQKTIEERAQRTWAAILDGIDAAPAAPVVLPEPTARTAGTEHTDQERSAALALGYRISVKRAGGGLFVTSQARRIPFKWDPAHDDGDGACMEAALGIGVDWWEEDEAVWCGVWKEGQIHDAVCKYADHGGDKQGARRMASLSVAASIGSALHA